MSALVEFNKNQDYNALKKSVDANSETIDPLIWKAVQGINEILALQRDHEINNSELIDKLSKALKNESHSDTLNQHLINITSEIKNNIRGKLGAHR